MKLQALGKTVIVEVHLLDEPQKTESGLFIPANSANQKTQNLAKVATVGEEVTTIKEGDTVIISRVGGEIFDLDGHHYYALQLTDIFAVIKKECVND